MDLQASYSSIVSHDTRDCLTYLVALAGYSVVRLGLSIGGGLAQFAATDSARRLQVTVVEVILDCHLFRDGNGRGREDVSSRLLLSLLFGLNHYLLLLKLLHCFSRICLLFFF